MVLIGMYLQNWEKFIALKFFVLENVVWKLEA